MRYNPDDWTSQGHRHGHGHGHGHGQGTSTSPHDHDYDACEDPSCTFCHANMGPHGMGFDGSPINDGMNFNDPAWGEMPQTNVSGNLGYDHTWNHGQSLAFAIIGDRSRGQAEERQSTMANIQQYNELYRAARPFTQSVQYTNNAFTTGLELNSEPNVTDYDWTRGYGSLFDHQPQPLQHDPDSIELTCFDDESNIDMFSVPAAVQPERSPFMGGGLRDGGLYNLQVPAGNHLPANHAPSAWEGFRSDSTRSVTEWSSSSSIYQGSRAVRSASTTTLTNKSSHRRAVSRALLELTCHVCQRSNAWASHDSFERHMHREHGENVEWHSCTKCEYKSIKPTDVRRHINSIHNTDETFSCPICRRKFPRRDNCRRHIRNVHKADREPNSHTSITSPSFDED